MKRITFISDTHNKHKQIMNDWLPGGDLLIHAGDISSMGYEHEIQQFCKWFNSIENYNHKVFIAGNHDWGFQNNSKKVIGIVNLYKGIKYIQDESLIIGEGEDTIKIYGSPWQPEFYNWAFNLPKSSSELEEKWNAIPKDTHILITHGPAHGYLDRVVGRYENLGCDLLTKKLEEIKTPIHVCGHIHSGRGYQRNDHTHFFNASVLNENYVMEYKPITIDWNPKTNEIEIL